MMPELFDLRRKTIDTAAGGISVVPTIWSRSDRLGQLRCRLFNSFRMNYTVQPGIYAVGSPDGQSPVLATANYRLSFDLLRRELNGFDAWILVLDTRGINVWCAAGKGTFGTEELIRRIHGSRLKEIVKHRRIILPQLGAPGVQAHFVKEHTGFGISYGPVYAHDLPAYLRSGDKATPAMRAVRFGFRERLELTPMEIGPALKAFLIFLAASFILFGLQSTGILFQSFLHGGVPVVLLGAAALLSGTFLTPLLLPWIPFRSFALKGFLAGAVVSGAIVFILRGSAVGGTIGGAVANIYLTAFTLVFFPAASSYLALQFTGSTSFTSISGVKRELKIALPLYTAAGAVSLVLLILYKVQEWGSV